MQILFYLWSELCRFALSSEVHTKINNCNKIYNAVLWSRVDFKGLAGQLRELMLLVVVLEILDKEPKYL